MIPTIASLTILKHSGGVCLGFTQEDIPVVLYEEGKEKEAEIVTEAIYEEEGVYL